MKTKSNKRKPWVICMLHSHATWGSSRLLCLRSNSFSTKAKRHHSMQHKQRLWLKQKRRWGGEWSHSQPVQPGCTQFKSQGSQQSGPCSRQNRLCELSKAHLQAKVLIPTSSGFKSYQMQISVRPLFCPCLQSNQPAFQVPSSAPLTQTLGGYSVAGSRGLNVNNQNYPQTIQPAQYYCHSVEQ